MYNLILNRQDELYAIAKALNMPELVRKTNDYLDKELYRVVGSDENGSITKICKKSTGEVFEVGQSFWSLKHSIWVERLSFDQYLHGTDFGGTFYKNYVRGINGIYHLNEISTKEPVKESETTPKSEDTCQPKTIKLDDKEYYLIEKEDP
jgi:hypothetical protein